MPRRPGAPEDDPRFLGVPTRRANPERITALREALADYAPVVAMMASPGWKWYLEAIEEKAAETTQQLIGTKGVSSLEEVFAKRERLAFMQWTLDLPAKLRLAQQQAQEELAELEGMQ